MYDIIGDIHGHADKLTALLTKLGYNDSQGFWSHPTRKVISLGDLVDRGPKQREVVDILKSMHQQGNALVIMGNHEFNAVSYYLKDKRGEPLREHSEKNQKQHQAFLDAAALDERWYEDTIKWFASLPLLIDNDKLRCIHAAWEAEHIAYLKSVLNHDMSLPSDMWEQANTSSHNLYEAIEYCLKGPEVNLPDNIYFFDKGKNPRHKMRVKWWDLNEQSSYRESAVSVPESSLSSLPTTKLPPDMLKPVSNDKPIFFGHYWMTGQPALLSAHIACLDWSVAKDNGPLAAYRFDGESTLDESKLEWA